MRSGSIPETDTLDGRGILVGVYVGKDIDEAVFRKIMAVIIMLTVAIMLLLEFKNLVIPDNKFFVANMGLASGFTTMLGTWRGIFQYLFSCYAFTQE